MDMFEEPVLGWLITAVVAAIIEVSVPHFGMIFVAGGAVAAAIAAVLGMGSIVQVAVFAVVVGASVAVLRPRLIARLRSRGVPSRTEALLGREAMVTHDIDPTLGTGRVNVAGQDWAARSEEPVATGTRVRVVAADGIVLEVRRS